MDQKIRAKSTKAEILEAYQALETAFTELQTKQEKAARAALAVPPPVTVKAVEKTVPPAETKPASPPRPETKEKPMTTTPTIAEVLPKIDSSVVQAQMDTVIKGLTQLGEQFNTALSQLSTTMLIEASRLKEISTQVETDSQRLTLLYSVIIEEDTLSKSIKQYAETAQQYEETLKRQREDSEKAWLGNMQGWQKEREETTQRWQEQEIAYKKSQQREETEYRYGLTWQRHRSEEESAQQKKQQAQGLKELQEQRQQAWNEREKALAEREKLFEEAKAKVEKFPKDLELAIKKAKEEGAGIARHQAKLKADLSAREITGEEEVYRLKIQALEQEVAKQTVYIDKLTLQLEAALKQVQELAVKAIEGSSSHSSYQALKEIALEQAKNQPKVK